MILNSLHGLSAETLEQIRCILRPFANSIERVGIFGSRATGRMRPQSDIDLVIFGPVDQLTIDRLWTLFSESSLEYSVDVVGYDLISYQPLKQHIDAVEQTLFRQPDLLEPSSSPAQSRFLGRVE
jgi:predicted nucleotidyltransferase